MRKRDLLILLLAFAVAITVAVGIFAGSALETGSWVLKPFFENILASSEQARGKFACDEVCEGLKNPQNLQKPLFDHAL